MMTELTPDSGNRIAYLIGLMFHPFVMAVLTLLIILSELPLQEGISWTLLISVILIIPLIIYLALRRRQGQYAYQRQMRGGVYRVGWISILVTLMLIHLLHAPDVLTACMAALAVWLPFQSSINRWITKVSTHTAVVTGCLTGLWLLGYLNRPLWQVLAITMIGLTAWARVVNKNHTPVQVMLGIMTGALPVLIVFPILMG
ncbi:MAG TPA: phosphatase PAP2 family protein [Phototrophicaceae bacterium]|jgi:membrane-associated phospholipid phosphatase|nr:phosphatase PAP2 family protein [Phototrophicaceae bacterium]